MVPKNKQTHKKKQTVKVITVPLRLCSISSFVNSDIILEIAWKIKITLQNRSLSFTKDLFATVLHQHNSQIMYHLAVRVSHV